MNTSLEAFERVITTNLFARGIMMQHHFKPVRDAHPKLQIVTKRILPGPARSSI